MDLNKSEVRYDSISHTYWLGEKQLRGITDVLRRHLFSDMYDNVNEETLNAKAEFGHSVHGQIELFDSGIDAESEYTKAYSEIKEKYGLETLANEYVVSDNENFASPIDVVMADNDGIWLVDVKTTYNFHKDYVAWQLSVYKYMFSLLNPDIPVKGVAGLWFCVRKGKLEKTQFIDLTDMIRQDSEVVKLLECEVNGTEYMPTSNTNCLPVTIDAEILVMRFEKEIKELTAKRDLLKKGLLEQMRKHGIKKYSGTYISLTMVDGASKTVFDSKTFKSDHPELYDEYLKTSKTTDSLRINILENV